MIVHTTPSFTLYFGNQSSCVSAADLPSLTTRTDAMQLPAFKTAQKTIRSSQLFFLHQIHSDQGVQVTPTNATTFMPFHTDGDFLMTNISHAGIGVLTADCLSIMLYDPMHNALAIIHAGWRGAVANIGTKTIEAMHQAYGTRPENLKVIFGPSARACCYQVTEEFIANIRNNVDCIDTVIQRHNNELYFDLPGFTLQSLLKTGVRKEHCLLKYNICTICDPAWCSYRRDGAQAGRQITAICLT